MTCSDIDFIIKGLSMRFVLVWVLVVIAAVVAIAFRSKATDTPQPTTARGLPELVAQVQPCVVRIRLLKRGPYGMRPSEGCGFVIDADGGVLTSAHVMEAVQTTTVVLADGREMPAAVVAIDPSVDLCCLRLTGAPAPPFLRFFGDGTVPVGEFVLTIGHPLGYVYTASPGIVSAASRRISYGSDVVVPDAMQVSCPVNLGSSGGPLVNARGDVVGVVAAFRSEGTNMAFAVPSATARRFMAGVPKRQSP